MLLCCSNTLCILAQPVPTSQDIQITKATHLITQPSTIAPLGVQDHTVDIPSGNGPSRGPGQPPSQQQDLRKSEGIELYCRQFWALFVKRAISAKRDRLAVVMQLLVPILLVLLALRAGKASSSLVQEPSLLISRWGALRCAF